jgi:hypothetical protein
MGKKLISCNSLDQYISREDQRRYLDSTLVLSPGARDELQRRGVEITRGAKPASQEKVPNPSADRDTELVAATNDRALIERIVRLLRDQYGLTDRDKILAVSLEVMENFGRQN